MRKKKTEFEWDEKKNALNIRKHGVSFEDAIMVFKDPKRYETYDKAHSFFEDRWKTVGVNNTTVLSVIFTEIEESNRIITVRKASKSEKEKYFYGYSTIYTN